jgi:hypothetical protein
MTIEELYNGIMVNAVQFAEDADRTDDVVIHATNSVLCYFMTTLQEAVENGNYLPLMDLSLIVGLNYDHLRKQ